MLIYSTVSQLGYVVLGVCLGTSLGVTGGLLHLFNHMLFKDLAFLCAGALMFASHAHNLEELGGMGRKMPITFLCFSAALFSAAGMPPFNGFNSKLVIYYALIERGELVLAIIAILSSVITLAYFLKFMHGAFFGQLTPAAERATEVGPAMRLPIMILGGLCLLTGVFPGLALIPLAGLEQTLGITPPQVGLTGIVSGYGAMNMTLLSFMLLAVGGRVWLGVARLTARRVRRTAIHTCGETSVDQRLTRISAGDLYAGPDQAFGRPVQGHFSLKRLEDSMTDVTEAVFAILLFPGGLFVLNLGLLLQGRGQKGGGPAAAARRPAPVPARARHHQAPDQGDAHSGYSQRTGLPAGAGAGAHRHVGDSGAYAHRRRVERRERAGRPACPALSAAHPGHGAYARGRLLQLALRLVGLLPRDVHDVRL
jgi:hypothetical protein